ncbi:hypothetical protein BDV95DRAFT_285778 [Massariosphaeria phaeospora]|uniref:Uncharacterized protein n=1 Tax=Massariosphaeria phaeospora TaxID=100035 RepID=A0A7C8ICA2_9PLEO|nr:hypothetical protein BDV95DRAFT_285778 [Massariosphaeria phaeospora]
MKGRKKGSRVLVVKCMLSCAGLDWIGLHGCFAGWLAGWLAGQSRHRTCVSRSLSLG